MMHSASLLPASPPFSLGRLLTLIAFSAGLVSAKPVPYYEDSSAHETTKFSSRQDIVINTPEDAVRYIIPPAWNQAMFWSGVPFELGQKAASTLGLKTLELSVGDEILNHPPAQSSSPDWNFFWGNFSVAFGEVAAHPAAGSEFVTVAIRAPNDLLTEASGPFADGRMVQTSDWARNEYPVIQAAGIRVMAMHPLESSTDVANDAYEGWPNDKAFEWQARHANAGLSATLTCSNGRTGFTATCINGDQRASTTVNIPQTLSLLPLEMGGACYFTVPQFGPSGDLATTYETITKSLSMEFACAA
ncbi:hypothetical protein B0J12DRAFT_742998 [Macrophomina phaseolina]|uniref:Uncharacterized protein n=1 Tax=Macrophomina phaseolina TaxID=35725 RepID=A0ABQ8G2E5_9PEZI|nr:hypothetical protein B0J12DRAFT_742998 [Macrophomina phaseolina]